MSINVSEFIWTIINFFLLLFLLKRFLFNPVLKLLDERQAHIENAEKAEKEARETVRVNDEKLAANRAQSRAEARRIVSDAKTADDKQHAELVAKTRAESVGNRRAMTAKVAEERHDIEAELNSAEDDLAESLADELLDTENAGPYTRADAGMPASSRDRDWTPHSAAPKEDEDITERILERARAMDKRSGKLADTGMTDAVIKLRDEVTDEVKSREMELAVLLAEQILGDDGADKE